MGKRLNAAHNKIREVRSIVSPKYEILAGLPAASSMLLMPSPNAVAETGECGLAVTFMAIAYDGTLRVLKNYSNNSSERRMRRQAQQNSLAETALHSALLPLTIEQPKFCPEITDN